MCNNLNMQAVPTNPVNYTKYMREIIKRSKSMIFSQAVDEWHLAGYYYVAKGMPDEYCLCGKSIRQVCLVRNRLTRNTATVGNCCVLRYMNIDIDVKVFNGFKKIIKDMYVYTPTALGEYAYEKGYLYNDEYERVGKRNTKNLKTVDRVTNYNINRRIIQGTVVNEAAKVNKAPREFPYKNPDGGWFGDGDA